MSWDGLVCGRHILMPANESDKSEGKFKKMRSEEMIKKTEGDN